MDVTGHSNNLYHRANWNGRGLLIMRPIILPTSLEMVANSCSKVM